jgi:ubiquinone/menaquinone biosynthesis C-methylase UbiE/uncharacterized protein YbaR (Trm112 family)
VFATRQPETGRDRLTRGGLELDVLPLLVCPGCREGRLRSVDLAGHGPGAELTLGVVICSACPAWYPVEGGVLELLAGDLVYRDDRARFWREHHLRLAELGILSDAPPAITGSADAQKHQQEHSEWYADNPVQTYSEYERLAFWQAVDAFTFARWRHRLRAGQLILDLGCAQGRSTSKLADLDLRIIGFDISKTLIRQALARPDRAGWRARTTFLVADASCLPFRDATFDGVLVYGVFHHLDDPAAAARDISRVLRDGGLCFALENNKTVLRSLFELLQRLRPAWYEEAGSHALMSAAELEGWLGAAGMRCDARTSVFLPPHLLNVLAPGLGARLIQATDGILGRLPWVRRQGGLVRVLAEKIPQRRSE